MTCLLSQLRVVRQPAVAVEDEHLRSLLVGGEVVDGAGNGRPRPGCGDNAPRQLLLEWRGHATVRALSILKRNSNI
jgi:hypothetical protein